MPAAWSTSSPVGGANKFHGDAFEYVRNRVFNAANYFSLRSNGVKTARPLKRNQFGGTIGGPHSRSITGTRRFFFFGYRPPASAPVALRRQATLPTPAQLAGTFTSLYDPTCTEDHCTVAYANHQRQSASNLHLHGQPAASTQPRWRC